MEGLEEFGGWLVRELKGYKGESDSQSSLLVLLCTCWLEEWVKNTTFFLRRYVVKGAARYANSGAQL